MKKKHVLFTESHIKTIEALSQLSIDNKEKAYFVDQFNETLDVINKLDKVDTRKIIPTSQVTGLVNVFREDVIDRERMLSQKEALSNAKNTKKGFFVVKAIFDAK